MTTMTKSEKGTKTKPSAWSAKEKNEESTQKMLNAVYQNATMAKECATVVLPFVTEQKLADDIRAHIQKYDDFVKRAEKLAKRNELILQQEKLFSRFCVKAGIKTKLTADSSSSRIAEMMLQGSTMGIIDLGRLIRHTADVEEDALTLCRELLTFEEDKTELMKYYL